MTTPTEEALATLAGFQSLLMDGETVRADIAKVIRDATISRSIDGVSTLALDIYDDGRKLLRSGIFSNRVTMSVDDWAFELVQVRKGGSSLGVTLEDLPVVALRRRNAPLKVAPNTTTHVDFAERLVKEEGWLNFWTPAEVRSSERAKIEMARGKPGTDTEAEEREDTWTAIGRHADVRGWRRYVRNKDTIAYVPETYLLAQPALYRFTENAQGIDYLDFDFDIGKPVATIKLKVRAARWAVPVGSSVEVYDMGPVNGKWIVSSISRSIFSLSMDVTLTQARPTLPEPPPPPPPTAAEYGKDGGSAKNKEKDTEIDFSQFESAPVQGGSGKEAVSKYGYVWPVHGRISSRFGQRGGRLHAGLDIAAPTGTPIIATRGGTVITTGSVDSYGLRVYINHGGSTVTRYAHMSKITVRRGMRISRGDEIGKVGSTGNSTGPHLHFELRRGGSPKDPELYMP